MQTEIIPLEINEVPSAILDTCNETRPAARLAAQAMRSYQPRHIYLIGNGTSLYTSQAASYTARSLADAEDPLVLAMPAGDFRHFPPALNARDVVIGMSASGEFRDVLAVFERLRGRCLLIGITHVPGSSITRLADFTLISAGGSSRVPVMTKTYASTLTAAHLLLLEFFSAPDVYYDDLLATADLSRQAVAQAEKRIPDLLAKISGFEHAFYFGAGSGYAAALEAALKMKEMALLHAEGSETWEMASGPATMVSEKTLCVAFYTGGAGDPDAEQGARKAYEWGARVLEIGPHAPAGDLHIPVQTPAYANFASLALVPPAALLAYRLAHLRGATPDTPSWRERYTSQGMTHILGE